MLANAKNQMLANFFKLKKKEKKNVKKERKKNSRDFR